MSIQKIHYKKMPYLVQKLWVLYFLDFIYSGLIRGFLPLPMSNVFYFLRLVIIVLIVLIFLSTGTSLDPFARFFVLLSLLFFGFQVILMVNNQLNFQTFVYGIYLYVVPFLGVAVAKSMDVNRNLSQYFRILKVALPLNLLVSVLQTVFNIEALYSAGFGAGLYASEGVQRATGTFSSSVGLSLFTTMTYIFLLSIHILKINRVPTYMWITLCFLILVSGSRTTFLNFGFLLFGVLAAKNARGLFFKSRNLKRVAISILFLFIVSLPLFGGVYRAGVIRFQSGNSINPPLVRLYQQLSLDGYEVNLFGTGLGTRALGAVNDLDRRILYANWVEFDNARILVEAGLLFLLLIWLAKFLFIVHVSIQKRKMANKERIIVNISLLGLIPYLLFAQIFGQGTMASGVFLIVYILLAFPIRQSTRNI